jgi:hypothetical protein
MREYLDGIKYLRSTKEYITEVLAAAKKLGLTHVKPVVLSKMPVI